MISQIHYKIVKATKVEVEMNHQDRDEFDKRVKGMTFPDDICYLNFRSGWELACGYKNKQLINGSRMKQMNEHIEQLKAENDILSKEVMAYKASADSLASKLADKASSHVKL